MAPAAKGGKAAAGRAAAFKPTATAVALHAKAQAFRQVRRQAAADSGSDDNDDEDGRRAVAAPRGGRAAASAAGDDDDTTEALLARWQAAKELEAADDGAAAAAEDAPKETDLFVSVRRLANSQLPSHRQAGEPARLGPRVRPRLTAPCARRVPCPLARRRWPCWRPLRRCWRKTT